MLAHHASLDIIKWALLHSTVTVKLNTRDACHMKLFGIIYVHQYQYFSIIYH